MIKSAIDEAWEVRKKKRKRENAAKYQAELKKQKSTS